MPQEPSTSSPPQAPLGELQAPTDALKMLVGELVIERIVSRDAIANLQKRVAELEAKLSAP